MVCKEAGIPAHTLMRMQESESMRVSMEPLFYAAGVDIVLYGHIHEYERSHAIFIRNLDAVS